MNKCILLALIAFSCFIIACNKDSESDKIHLSGTEWRSDDVDELDEEYYALVFTSETTVVFKMKFDNDPTVYASWNSVYSVSGNQLIITRTYGDLTGGIEENKINLLLGGRVNVFTKQ